MKPAILALAITAFVMAVPAASPGPAGQPARFRAGTRLVVVHATVRNGRGEIVTTLNRDAFTVYENGKRQPI